MISMNGVVVIDKPAGITSHDVVARTRHILHERRIGHTGTLDPFATGVLVVLIGRATRLAQFLSGADKEYEAIIRLGYATDTGDRTGQRNDAEIKGESSGPWRPGEIESALSSLRGNIQQIPPMFSAKKVGGARLYDLARRGESIERKPIAVCIHEFVPLQPDGQLLKDNLDGTFDFHVRVACSAGTYIRTLAEDLGKRLRVGAHLAELRRTRVGNFSIDEAITLEGLRSSFGEEALGTVLLRPESALRHLPFVHLSDEDERKVRHGREIFVEDANWPDSSQVRMCDHEGRLLAVGDYSAIDHLLHPRIVIAEQ
jgi:tRNA pseudouridine55 synthase